MKRRGRGRTHQGVFGTGKRRRAKFRFFLYFLSLASAEGGEYCPGAVAAFCHKCDSICSTQNVSVRS